MNNQSPSARFLLEAGDVVTRLAETNLESIEAAADDAAERIVKGGRLKVFGCGHSGLVCQDVFYRAGGLRDLSWLHAAKTRLDHDPVAETSRHEKTSGWIEEVLRGQLDPGDVLVVVSTSGVNAVPVEAARVAREAGCLVIAIRSAVYDERLAPRHESGTRLSDAAHHVFDNLSPYGDTLVEVSGGKRMGSASTAVGAILLQAFTIAVHEAAAARGTNLDVWVSANVPAES